MESHNKIYIAVYPYPILHQEKNIKKFKNAFFNRAKVNNDAVLYPLKYIKSSYMI